MLLYEYSFLLGDLIYMIVQRFLKSKCVGLGLSAGLALGVWGCGGADEKIDNGVVTPSPGEANYSSGGAGGGTAASSTASTSKPVDSSTTAAKPDSGTSTAAPTKSEGWGTLKGTVVFEGSVPAAKMLVPKGATDKDVKDGAYCGKDGVPSQSLEVDPVTKGVRYALVYLPKPTAVNPEAKSARHSAKSNSIRKTVCSSRTSWASKRDRRWL